MRYEASLMGWSFWMMFCLLALLAGTEALVPSTALTNLALRKPCAPQPSCSVLVDGHSESVEGIDRHSSDLSVPASTFKVFLPLVSFVDRIVIYCKRFTTLSAFLGSSKPPSERPAVIRVTLWSDVDKSHGGSSSKVQKKHIFTSSQETFDAIPEVQHVHGDIRLEISVMQSAASVEIEVESGESLCTAQHDVAEVQVLGQEVQPDMPNLSRKPASDKQYAGSAPNLASFRRALEEPPSAPARRDSANMYPPPQDRVVAMKIENIAPPTPPAKLAQVTTLWPTLNAAIGFLTLYAFTALLFALVVGVLFFACISFRHGSKHQALDGPGDVTTVGTPSFQSTGTEFFFIGEGEPTSEPPVFGNSCSEPEPEAEIDPPSTPSTPRNAGSLCAPSTLACAGTTARAVQPSTEMRRVSDVVTRTPKADMPLLPQPSVSAPQPASSSVEMTPQSSQSNSVKGSRRSRRGDKQVVMLFASPLCFEDPRRGVSILPQTAFEVEWSVMAQAHEEAVYAIQMLERKPKSPRPLVSLTPRPLTAANLQRMIATNSATVAATVLHLSAHGADENLVLENGKRPCTAHVLTCDQLGAMLDLRKNLDDGIGPRLVILNACSSRRAGMTFAQYGIPHVLCTVADIRDSWGRIFFHKVYSCLFQGSTVAEAFKAAVVALRNDPDSAADAADAFCLLPEDDPHDEVLFPLDPAVSAALLRSAAKSVFAVDLSDASELSEAASETDKEFYTYSKRTAISASLRRQTPLNRAVPLLPDNFIGRTVDVWRVQQQLTYRRLVVVCGGANTGHGIGKTTVLDAVQRTLTMQLGVPCIGIKFQQQECGCGSATTCTCWISQLRESVRKSISNIKQGDSAGLFQRCVRTRRCLQAGHLGKFYGEFGRQESNDHHPSCMGCNQGCLSNNVVFDAALEALVTDMLGLLRLTRDQKFGGEWWPATAANGLFASNGGENGSALFILDGCDDLVQQEEFQEAIADILRRCPGVRFLFSTHRPVVAFSQSWCQFKVAHYPLESLAPLDSARLFLRRIHRPLHWEELLESPANVDDQQVNACNSRGTVVLTTENESTVLRMVACHSAIASQKGNPRALIELANKVGPALTSLQDLSARSLVKGPSFLGTRDWAVPPMQGLMPS
jgi:hypothetical protein